VLGLGGLEAEFRYVRFLVFLAHGFVRLSFCSALYIIIPY